MTKKTFDCIAFLNGAAEDTRERLSGLSARDQAAYWRMRNREVLAEQRRVATRKGEMPDFGFVARLEMLRKRRKSFDCVAMKHEAQERIRKELEGKSPEEQREYWRKKTQELRALQQQARLKQRHAQG